MKVTTQSAKVSWCAVIVLGTLTWGLQQSPVKADPELAPLVEELRLTLKSHGSNLEEREKLLKAHVESLKTPNDLLSALGLMEWRDEFPDDNVAGLDRKFREQ